MLNTAAFLIYAIVIGSIYFIILEFGRLERYYGRFYKEKLETKKRLFDRLKDEDDKITIFNKQLDKRILEIANLYELTKQMSGTLVSMDIFLILAIFLRKSFSFRKCNLILLERKELRVIDKIYEIHGAREAGAQKVYIARPKVHSAEPDEANIALVAHMIEDKELVRISSFSKVLDQKKPYIPKGITSFLAVPLFVEGSLVGVLSIEDLPGDEFDNFLVLSRQFTLEMRKVVLYAKVQEMAITDGLTGTYVRRHFMERLDEELKRSRRHKLKFSFLMLDIDHFKNCNDSYGHLVGDAVLKKTVNILKSSLRQIDLVARYGGEEFSVLLPDTEKEGALLVAERIRSAIAAERFNVYDEFANITVSIGVATFPDDTQKMGELIEAADKALYKAKSDGRNRVCSI